jgi:hypothetical protein
MRVILRRYPATGRVIDCDGRSADRRPLASVHVHLAGTCMRYLSKVPTPSILCLQCQTRGRLRRIAGKYGQAKSSELAPGQQAGRSLLHFIIALLGVVSSSFSVFAGWWRPFLARPGRFRRTGRTRTARAACGTQGKSAPATGSAVAGSGRPGALLLSRPPLPPVGRPGWGAAGRRQRDVDSESAVV